MNRGTTWRYAVTACVLGGLACLALLVAVSYCIYIESAGSADELSEGAVASAAPTAAPAQENGAGLRRLALGVAGVASIFLVVGAAFSSYRLAARALALQQTVDDNLVERATEVKALGGGLAHEVRNPLHAIQLNLYTLRRAGKRGDPLSEREMKMLVDQSVAEIGRIELLMQRLVGFAAPAEPRDEIIDIRAGLCDAVQFVQQEFLDAGIELQSDPTTKPVYVRMDHGRFRQVVLSLLQNSQEALPEGGRVAAELEPRFDTAELRISDDGKGVAAADRVKIFDPFFSTKEGGAGLGLALGRRFIVEAGGEIRCEENNRGGATFCILLPIAQNGIPQGDRS